MFRLDVHKAKTHLSQYLAKLAVGKKIILCKYDVPVAEIHPLKQSKTKPRPIGLAKGAFRGFAGVLPAPSR